MDNADISLLHDFVGALQNATGFTVEHEELEVQFGVGRPNDRLDVLVATRTPDGGECILAIEIKRVAYPRDVRMAISHLVTYRNSTPRNDRIELRKDAADLVHVMRYWGTLESLAQAFIERLVTNTYTSAIDRALAALVTNFCDDTSIPGYRKDGPSAVANFQGLQEGEEGERIRVQRDVSGMVTYFLQQVTQMRENGSACQQVLD